MGNTYRSGMSIFGEAGNRLFGLLPHFFRLMFLSRFVKHLRGQAFRRLPGRARWRSSGNSSKPGQSRRVSTVPTTGTAREAIRSMIEDELQGKVIIIAADAGSR